MAKKPKKKVHKLQGQSITTGSPTTGMYATLRAFSHLPSEHPFYSLVGRVASEWSHLEHALDDIIWWLASFRSAGLGSNIVACITSQVMGIGPRCKIIASLASAYAIHSAELRKQLNKVKSHSYLVADERARIVHDPWWIDIGSKGPVQFRAMPASDPFYGFKDISKSDMESTITKIRSLQKEVAILHDLVQSELASLRRKLDE